MPSSHRSRSPFQTRSTSAPLFLEAGDRLSLLVVALEHRQQLGEDQQVLQPLGDAQQLQLPIEVTRCRVDLHELTEARAVHVRDVAEVEQQLAIPLLKQALDLVL